MFDRFRFTMFASAGLLSLPSACSLEASAPPAARTCADHHPAAKPPALANPKLAAGTRPLCFYAFAALHSGVTRSPLWVAEHLTRASVEAAIDALRLNISTPRRLL